MVVLGYVLYDDDELTLTSPTQAEYTAGCPRETFATTQVVNVTNTTAKELTATLDRIVARCSFVLTDEAIPSDVKKLQFYYTGGSGAFNAATGLGSVASKQTVTFDVSSGSQKQFDLYTFLHDLSDTIALKVTALDASGNVLYERDLIEHRGSKKTGGYHAL